MKLQSKHKNKEINFENFENHFNITYKVNNYLI